MPIRKSLLASAATIAAVGGFAAPAHAGPEPYLGQVTYYGFNFCPRGWTYADGRLLAISSYSALYALYGTTYGGDGVTTFGMPDLRGTVAINAGQGPGLSNYTLGETAGSEYVSLNVQQIPSHTHGFTNTPPRLPTSSTPPTTNSPNDNSIGPTIGNRFVTGNGDQNGMAIDENVSLGITGAGVSHENRPPYLTVNACVAIEGIFPPRN